MTRTENKFYGLTDNHCLASYKLEYFGHDIYVLEII